ncbi:hypothetical protein ACFFRR_000062 [Megaselia abdita]
MDKVFTPGPTIINATNPNDLEDLPILKYPTGLDAITAACTGPDEGLRGIKRSKLHFSAGSDIDFIDTNIETDFDIRKSSSGQLNAKIRSRKNSRSNDVHFKNALSKTEEKENENALTLEKTIIDSSRLLREAVTNQIVKHDLGTYADTIAGVQNWKMECDNAYGISVSLYENNMLTKDTMGNPIADCYGMAVRGNVAIMAMADGVNWGDGARLAARSAVHGCIEYLNTSIFGLTPECTASSTKEVFICLLRSLWEAHDCILEVGGALTTLTVAVVLPLGGQNADRYVVCACNVGDSLGYVYSKKHGVREFTEGSHDISSNRDMRDALGALGPADGTKPELSNLTLSMTTVDAGDIVFLTSDGISDNFDPVVGKFAEAWTKTDLITTKPNITTNNMLAPKRQNKSASSLNTKLKNTMVPTKLPRTRRLPSEEPSTSSSTSSSTSLSKSNQRHTLQKSISTSPSVSVRPQLMRSKTLIEPRVSLTHQRPRIVSIPKSPSGLPYVTGPQRHALTLLRLEDLLSYGINGNLCPCPSARRLCQLIIDFVRMITSARRKTLEQRELFYKIVTGPDGIRREVEMNRVQHRSARRRIVESAAFAALPGKLDHASVVAFTVGSGLQKKEFQETNF